MQINKTKAKLLAGEAAFGYELGFGSPLIAEALAGTGIDYVQIDNQHGDWGPDSTITALTAVAGAGATPIARVARNDYTMIGRLLDAGCMGIVVPMVHTVADAKDAADSVRFPPHGQRSCGWGRVARNDDTYWDWIDEQVLLMVQIESITAVDNAEAILSTPGVDGCWVGPSDLAYSMGLHPKHMATDEKHAQAVERALLACRNTGKIPGIACGSPEDAVRRKEQGFRFLNAGGDHTLIMTAARAGVATVGLSPAGSKAPGSSY